MRPRLDQLEADLMQAILFLATLMHIVLGSGRIP